MEHRTLDDHRDHRGYVINPFAHLENTGDITNFHTFTIEPGHSRGNHLHPARNEQVLVLAGEISVETSAGTRVLTGLSPSILTIPGGMEHTFTNNSRETAVVMCWSSQRESGYEGEDTVRAAPR